MKVAIIYNSKTGNTKNLSEQMLSVLESKNHEVSLQSIDNADLSVINDAELLLLGDWTQGLFIFLQHPTKEWKTFANKLPDLSNKKVILYNSYALCSGGMLNKMEKELDGKNASIIGKFKNKKNVLSIDAKCFLEEV